MPSRPRSPYFGIALVAGAFFMENLDGTVIATAMPQMAHSFQVSPVDLHIGMTAYILTLAIFIPISGWVADRFGSCSTFAGAIGVFTFASLLCALCDGLTTFTAARVLQGLGGAMMVPVGRLVVLRTTEKKDLVDAIAYITWPGLIAPLVAPPLGGFLTTYANWRWIFFLNIPLGIVGFILALLWIRNEKVPEAPPLDHWTFLFSALGCTAFVYALELLRRPTVAWGTAALLLGLTAVMGVLAVRSTRRAVAPLIDLESLHLRTFSVSILGGSLFRIAISVSPFLLPLMFQIAFGLNAFQAGSLLLALFAGNLAMKPLTTPLLKRYGFRTVLIVNGLVTALAITLCAFLAPGLPKALLLGVLFLNGLCRSLQFTSFNTIAFVDVPRERMGSANSFSSLVQRLSMGLGVVGGALALKLASVLRGRPGGAPTLTDFQIAFLMVGVVALVGVLDSFKLAPDAGSIATGHRAK